MGVAAARDSANLRESARQAGACSSAAAITPRLEPHATRSPLASACPGYLYSGRVRQLRLPPHPPLPGARSTRGISSRTRAWVCCLEAFASAPRVPPPWTLVPVSFLALTLARRTSAPYPVPATSTPGQAATLPGASLAAAAAAAANFRSSLSARRSGVGVTCVKQISARSLGRVSDPTLPLVVLFKICLGMGESREREDCCWLTDDF